MKIPFTAAAVLLLMIIGCNSPAKDNVAVAGAYKMLSQNIKSAKLDTSYKTLQQQKIYTDNYMMFTNFNPPDSVSAFGIGTYSSNADTVTENVFYSASDSSFSDKPASFKLAIEKTAKGYKQFIPEIQTSNGDKISLTEEYETIGTEAKSLLDGAWKMEKRMYIKGKDTSADKAVQFKVYYAGHFVWGHSWPDSLHKNHTGVGYGTYSMDGTSKVKETVTLSTYKEINGLDFSIGLVMDGNDAMTQTIINKDSSRQVEMYKRLK